MLVSGELLDSGEDIIWGAVFIQLSGSSRTSEMNMHNCVCIFLFLNYLLFLHICVTA